MARRFRGEGLHKVDAKGRVSIPALFRRVLEANDEDGADPKAPNLVIHYGTSKKGYLECYSMAAVEEVDEKIAAMPRGSKERDFMETYFHGMSHPTSVDETGRLVLPQKLRDLIGIGNEAYFIAAGDRFRIWNPATYQEQVRPKTEDLLDQLSDDMDPMALLEGGSL